MRRSVMARLSKTASITLVSGALCLGACAASLKVARFDQVSRPPKRGDVDVFSSPQAVTRPYKEIALITAEEGWSDSITDLTQKMIAQARTLGADGIILLGAGQNPAGGVLVGSVYVAGNSNTTRCTAIVYTDAR